MSIFKGSFHQSIKDQLTKRQEVINNRTSQHLSYLNSRNAWIRLSSSVNIYSKDAPRSGGEEKFPTVEELQEPANYDYTLANKYILQGGILNDNKLRAGLGDFSNAYSNVGADGKPYHLGIRPMPGITGVDIKTKGAYGSLRSATVNFQCWDVRQLEDLELLYMRPGYTLLLEWGWTPYILTDPNDPNKDKYITTVDYTDIIKTEWTKEDLFKSQYARATDGKYKTEDGTDKIVTGYQGNADSMFGFVKNYSWKARMDGGYDCTTELISIGEVIESLKVNYSPLDKITDIAKFGLLSKNVGHFKPKDIPEKKLKEYYMQNILAGLFFELRQSFGIATGRSIIIDSGNFEFSDDVGKSFTLKDTTYESDYDMFGVTININGGEGSTTDEGLGKSDEQIYITLNSLCTLLNNYVLVSDTKSVNANKNTEKNKINGGKSRPLSPLTTNEMDGSDLVPLLALAHPLQLSIDPTVCLIKSPIWYNGFKIETEKDTKGEPVVTFSHNLTNPSLSPSTFVKTLINNFLPITYENKDVSRPIILKYITDYIQGPEDGSGTRPNGSDQIKDNLKEITKTFNELYKTHLIEAPTLSASWGLKFTHPDRIGQTLQANFNSTNTFYDLLEDTVGGNLDDSDIDKALGGTDNRNDIADGDPVKEAREKIKEEEEKMAKAAGNSATGFKFLEKLEKEYFDGGLDIENNLGIIGNIYVNINMLYNLCVNNNLQETDKKEKKEIAIYDYIKSVLKKISPAIGNVNNFDIFVNPDTNVAQIIDINYVDKLSAAQAYTNAFELKIHNLESIVRSYSLESKIFPEQTSIVAIAAQVGGGALGIDTTTLVAFNKFIRDRIIPIKDSPITTSVALPDNNKKIEFLKDSLAIIYLIGSDLDDNWWGGDRDFDVDDATKYQNALKDIISFFVELGKPKMKGKAILPTVLNIDMDGIGGIIIGNLFKTNTNILPKGYKNMGEGIKLGYIVTEIGHSLQGNDWVTKIAAQTIILEEPQGVGINFNDILVKIKSTGETKVILDPKGLPSKRTSAPSGGSKIYIYPG